jgi:hypothetical protein
MLKYIEAYLSHLVEIFFLFTGLTSDFWKLKKETATSSAMKILL